MVAHGFGESRLDALEALVDRVWIPAVQRDQLFSRLAAPDDFKRVNLDPSNDRFRNRGRRLPAKTELCASAVRLHHRRVGSSGVNGQDVNTSALQFTARRFSETGEACLRGCIGCIAWKGKAMSAIPEVTLTTRPSPLARRCRSEARVSRIGATRSTSIIALISGPDVSSRRPVLVGQGYRGRRAPPTPP